MCMIRKEKTKRDFHSVNYFVSALQKESIRDDHPQQRDSNQHSAEERDGIIGTVIKNEDLPYIVTCEQITEHGVDVYLIDGKQRLSAIFNYKKGAFKLGKNVENPLVEYWVNVLDENGVPQRDDEGNLIHEVKVCDIRGKGYKDLPEELQEIFNDYQIMEVKHLDCTEEEIGYHIRRYNHAKKMGASQSGITHLDRWIAMKVKEIAKTHTFFKDLGNFKPSEDNNDTKSRVVLESIMATYFMENWKSPLKDICSFLNGNITEEIICTFKSELDSISEVLTEETAKMFTSKNSFLWLVTYHKFAKLGLVPKKFIEFMEEFDKNLSTKEWNGETFDKMNEVSTKKKNCIIKKLQLMEEFMNEFLHINKEDLEDVDTLDFVKENVKADATEEDVDFYSDMLDDLTLEVDNNTKLLDEHNRPSLIALVGYACENECDDRLQEWVKNFFVNNLTYKLNQRENYLHMLNTFQRGATA